MKNLTNKERANVTNKVIKINLTEAEYSEFINKRKVAGYITNAAFARGVLVNAEGNSDVNNKNKLLKKYTKTSKEDLLIKTIKTNLTETEYSEFINKRKAAGYRANAAFARNVLINTVKLK